MYTEFVKFTNTIPDFFGWALVAILGAVALVAGYKLMKFIVTAIKENIEN